MPAKKRNSCARESENANFVTSSEIKFPNVAVRTKMPLQQTSLSLVLLRMRMGGI